MSSWDVSVGFVLQMEGGYVNDPNDPGGETNYGISKRSYPNLDIKNLTVDQAKEIYYKDFWLPARCDKLSAPLALVVLDAAVNMGLGAAASLLQGTTSLDEFCLRRILRYSTYKNFGLYGRSWIHRVLASYKLALTLAGPPSNS